MIDRWPDAFWWRLLAQNEGFAFTPYAQTIQLGNLPALLYKANGENSKINGLEADLFIVSGQANYLLSVELASPGSQ